MSNNLKEIISKNINMEYLKRDYKFFKISNLNLTNDELINEYIKNYKNIFSTYKDLFAKFYYFNENPYKNIYFRKNILDLFYHKFVKNYNSKLIVSIHCFDLNQLDIYFDKMIKDIISQGYAIIITYCISNEDLLNQYNKITFLKVDNKGLDLINKFSINFLLNYFKVDYKYIFYIHSKNNQIARDSYLKLYFNNKSKINNLLKENENIGGLFPNILHIGDKKIRTAWNVNKRNIDQICKYLNLKNNLIFPEGNVYILNKKVADFIYSDIKLFNNLNTFNSIDFNWIRKYYKLKCNSNELYNYISTNNIYGNLYDVMNNKNVKILRDGMYEHVFERIIFSVCIKCNLNIKVLSIENKVSENYLDTISECIFNGRNYNHLTNFDVTFYNKYNNLSFKSFETSMEHYANIGIYKEYPINKLQIKNDYKI